MVYFDKTLFLFVLLFLFISKYDIRDKRHKITTFGIQIMFVFYIKINVGLGYQNPSFK